MSRWRAGPAQGDYEPCIRMTTSNGAVDQRRLSDGAPARRHFRFRSTGQALKELAFAFKEKAVEFARRPENGPHGIAGRGADDARPGVRRLSMDDQGGCRPPEEISGLFREVSLGATAIGTGINADPRYSPRGRRTCAGVRHARSRHNLIEATSDMGAFVLFTGLLKRVAIELLKDLQRSAPAVLGSQDRDLEKRVAAAAGAGGFLDHARQGQSGDPGGGESGRVPGHGP